MRYALVNTPLLAALAGIPARRIRRWARRGLLRPRRVSSRTQWLYHCEEALAFCDFRHAVIRAGLLCRAQLTPPPHPACSAIPPPAQRPRGWDQATWNR